MTKKPRLFTRQEWLWLLLCVLILTIPSDLGSQFAVFQIPLISEFGWSRGSLGLVFFIFMVSKSLSGILMGALSDRYGLRRIITIGALIAASGLALSSLTQNLWHLYLFYGVVAGTGFGAFSVPVLAFIQRSFTHRRGLATAITGLGLGALLIRPWLPLLLVKTGWRAGFIFQGGLVLALTLSLAYLLKRTMRAKPEESEADPTAYLTRGTANPIWYIGDGKKGWLYAVLASSIGSYYSSIVLTAHRVSIFSDFGFPSQKYWLALGVTLALGGLIGPIGCGLLSDRFGAKWPLFTSIALVTIPAPLFLVSGLPEILFLNVMLLGLGTGGLFIAYPVLLRDLFGPKHIGLHLGIILFGSFVGGRFSTYVTNLLHDATGSYILPFLLSFFIGLIALALAWFIPDTRRTGAMEEQ